MKSGNHSELQTRLVEHVRRYRIGVIPIASGMLRATKADVKAAAVELMKSGRLASESLYHTRRYLYECPDETTRRGTGPVSERAKINALATLLFCSAESDRREILTAAEFQKHFSDLYRPSGSGRYVLDQSSGQPRLSFVRVDCGGRGRWDRVICKARRDLDRHRLIAAFDELIERDLFEIHILTALECKAERIRQTLTESAEAPGQRVQVTALPDLIHLVFPQPHSFPQRRGK